MTAKKTKDAEQSVLRTPKPKNKLGLFVPKISLPHEEFVKPAEAPELHLVTSAPSVTENVIDSATLPSQTTQPSQTSHTTQTRQSEPTSQTRQSKKIIKSPISPERNHQKVPNSIVNVAIPAGVFKGKSKLLYDVLYGLTRGAIAPKRTVRARKTELMKKAGIGSRITFDSNIQHLVAVGLLREKVLPGEHSGNEFEVFTIEEIGTLTSLTSQASEGTQTSHAQKVDRLVSLETSQTSQGLNNNKEETYRIFKTFFKDSFKTDDEKPLIKFVETLNEAAHAATGKDLTAKDFEALFEIAELIVSETNVAQTRTSGISVYLKFAAENLRRRLYTKNAGGSEKRGGASTKLSEPVNSYEPEPLGENREVILENLRKIVEENGLEAVEVFSGSYTEDDWNWILSNL